MHTVRPGVVPLLAAVVAAVATGAGKPSNPVTHVLESTVLRLEVASTYGYKLIEKSTGNVLLSQNQTTFTLGTSSVTASGISKVQTTSNSLTGTLALNKTNTAQVTFTFVSPENLQVTLQSNGTTPAAIQERFADGGERYYGVWETAFPTALDNRGISAAYNGQETLTTKDVFASSARAPFYFTNRHYGVYTNTEAQGTYTFGVSGSTSFKFSSPTLQYNILHGSTPRQILAQHNTVAGPAFMPPDWAFSTIFWRDDFHRLPTENPAITNAQQLILDDAAKLQAANIHAGAMWIDRPYGTGVGDTNVSGWGNMDFDASFPNPSAMVQALDAGGINLMLWIANKANNQLKSEGSSAGYLFASSSASPGIDLRIPNAYNWFKGKLGVLDQQALLADGSSGIKGYKIDRGGEGEIPLSLVNTETTLVQKAAFENMLAQHPDGDFFNFTRNINGAGRKYAAVWSGDPKTTWLGFQSTIKNGLRTGIINFPMWGSDTGGYNGGAPSEELFSRWVAFSAFSPMMEIIQGPSRNIFYNFSSRQLATTQKFTAIHHDLIPYTRSALAEALQTGMPIMRAMVLEFPNDAAVANTWDQYMYGPNILVAPVSTSGVTGRNVYLPQLPQGGRWLDYNDCKTVYAGGMTVTASAAIDVLPLYVREGATIPRGDIVKGNNNWSGTWSPSLRIEVFPSNFPSSFAYYNGVGITDITAGPLPEDGGFFVDAGDLLLPGQLDVYVVGPQSLWLNEVELFAGTDYTYDAANNLLSVPFAAGPFSLDIWGASSIFGTSVQFTSLARVPEPRSLLMLGIGAAAMLVRRRHGLRALRGIAMAHAA